MTYLRDDSPDPVGDDVALLVWSCLSGVVLAVVWGAVCWLADAPKPWWPLLLVPVALIGALIGVGSYLGIGDRIRLLWATWKRNALVAEMHRQLQSSSGIAAETRAIPPAFAVPATEERPGRGVETPVGRFSGGADVR